MPIFFHTPDKSTHLSKPPQQKPLGKLEGFLLFVGFILAVLYALSSTDCEGMRKISSPGVVEHLFVVSQCYR